MNDEEPSINIPSLLMLAVVSFFVVRWFMNRGNSGANATGRARGGRMIDPAHVEQISQMFPQLNRRDIMWDLQRNGGSMAATTERILTGRGLDTPPPSYQPQIPQPATPVPSATPAPATKSGSQDLISRYNLSQRISEDQQETPSKQETGWSQNKTERQRLLQKRRDDMILAARRKLQQKDRETSHATGPAF